MYCSKDSCPCYCCALLLLCVQLVCVLSVCLVCFISRPPLEGIGKVVGVGVVSCLDRLVVSRCFFVVCVDVLCVVVCCYWIVRLVW